MGKKGKDINLTKLLLAKTKSSSNKTKYTRLLANR